MVWGFSLRRGHRGSLSDEVGEWRSHRESGCSSLECPTLCAMICLAAAPSYLAPPVARPWNCLIIERCCVDGKDEFVSSLSKDTAMIQQSVPERCDPSPGHSLEFGSRFPNCSYCWGGVSAAPCSFLRVISKSPWNLGLARCWIPPIHTLAVASSTPPACASCTTP